MRCGIIWATSLIVSLSVTAGWPQVRPGRWRGAGATPCMSSDGGIRQCPPTAGVIAILAGHMFDSDTGQMLTRQLVIISGERITQVGPEAQVRIPRGATVIDLSQATVLPGLIDAHTHMFDTRGRNGTTEQSMLIAVRNAQSDLRAGFTSARDMSTHGNGYGDLAVRDAINLGYIDGPRYQVSTRGIVWGSAPEDPMAPDSPMDAEVVRSVEQARAAVREQIGHGADWIKLFTSDNYAFNGTGTPEFKATYPMPVLAALVDETHLLGKKVACHAMGGKGLENAIAASCDTIEHGLGLTHEEVTTMVRKGLYYDPTIVRYTLPEMDDHDAKSTGGKFRMIPIFEKAVTMAVATRGLNVIFGSGVDGAMYAHGTQALDFEALVMRAGMNPSRAIQAATKINAEMLGWQNRVGSIDSGKFADVIAVSGNPLTDITELQRVKFVMKGGKVIKNELTQCAGK